MVNAAEIARAMPSAASANVNPDERSGGKDQRRATRSGRADTGRNAASAAPAPSVKRAEIVSTGYEVRHALTQNRTHCSLQCVPKHVLRKSCADATELRQAAVIFASLTTASTLNLPDAERRVHDQRERPDCHLADRREVIHRIVWPRREQPRDDRKAVRRNHHRAVIRRRSSAG